MGHSHKIVMVAALVLVFASELTAQPAITGVNSIDLPRSGRLAIQGYGFGAGGEVYIGGLEAWTTTWTDSRVVAYVPEAAALGATTVHVTVGGLDSNEVDLVVTARQSNGRIRWTFEADTDNLWWRPALSPNGTIYLHSSHGLIYALSPEGGLLWVQRVNGYPYVPPTAGPDGAVYVGTIGTIYRISPDGVIDWQYRPPNGVNIEVSPTIGPNGLLYGAFEISGAFAIEPLTGLLVWSNPGNPMMSDKSGEAVVAVFGPRGPGQPVDQFYVSMDGGAGFYGFSLDGDQLFTASFGNLKGSAEVAIGSDGTIYGPRAIGLVVAAVDPSDGSTLWEYYPGASDWATGTNNVEIGPDDTLYFVGSSAKLEAFDPHSQSREWQFFDSDYALNRPSVTPDGSTLILCGSNTSVYGYPGFVKAFNTRNGRELWSVNLPFQLNPGFRVYGVHHPRITTDGATAYVSTLSLAEYPLGQDPHTLVFAIDITGDGGSEPPPTTCNGDGICSVGEDCLTCPDECPGKTGGNPSNRWCCGDGVCSEQEDSSVCSLDCGALPVCGDAACDAGEDPCSCSIDCGTAPASEVPGVTCNDGIDNDCDGFVDCADPDCTGSNECLCGGKNATCTSNADCCSSVCKRNGRCQ